MGIFWTLLADIYETLLMMAANKYCQAHIYHTISLRVQNSILEGLIPDVVFKNGPDMDQDLIILSLLTPGPALVPFCYQFEFPGER